jgi:hypothetical protein
MLMWSYVTAHGLSWQIARSWRGGFARLPWLLLGRKKLDDIEYVRRGGIRPQSQCGYVVP